MPREGGATKEGEGRERGETDWAKEKRGELSTFYPGVRRRSGGGGELLWRGKNSIVGRELGALLQILWLSWMGATS